MEPFEWLAIKRRRYCGVSRVRSELAMADRIEELETRGGLNSFIGTLK